MIKNDYLSVKITGTSFEKDLTTISVKLKLR
jgi:hypothetical protein